MTLPRRLLMMTAGAALAAAPLAIASPAWAADPGVKGPVTGTISLTAKGVAAGVGYTWGDGTLRFGGKTYRFTVSGITVADVGYSKVSGHGRIYGLHRLQDFSGTYAAATGEATVGKGLAGEVLQNDHGVQIRIDENTKGARLQGSADGIKLTLK